MSSIRTWPRETCSAVSDEICTWLRPITTRTLVVGSVRRGRKLVLNLDLLIILRCDADELRSKLTELVFMREIHVVPERDRGVVEIIHAASGLPVKLHLCPANMARWWGLVVVRTGSKDWIKHLRRELARDGRALHEDGRVEIVAGVVAEPKSERGVFRLLKVPWVHPEQRG